MNRNKLTIGLFGFGCVGSGLHEVLQKTPTLKTTIKTICVKNKNKTRPLPNHYYTFDRNLILNDPEINVVVELIDDPDAAFEIVSASIKKGKAVVTANKKMIAEHFTELLALQKEHNVPLLYEAACCASIPIIRSLEEYFDNDLLESIEGIVNGSTNYILTKSVSENLSFAQALKVAQEKGYAETNPILDTGGFDAKYKLLILIAHAFGVVPIPDQILNFGIDQLSETDFKYAKEKGLKIKLVAKAYKNKFGTISAFVMPKFVNHDEKLYAVDDVFNGVITKTSFADTQFFCGKGAGAFPTASAVLSDISALSYEYRYSYKKLNTNDKLTSPEDIFLKVFLRLDLNDETKIKVLFHEILESYKNHASGYIIGVISLKNLKKISLTKDKGFSPVLIETLEHTPIIDEKHPAMNALAFAEEL